MLSGRKPFTHGMAPDRASFKRKHMCIYIYICIYVYNYIYIYPLLPSRRCHVSWSMKTCQHSVEALLKNSKEGTLAKRTTPHVHLSTNFQPQPQGHREEPLYHVATWPISSSRKLQFLMGSFCCHFCSCPSKDRKCSASKACTSRSARARRPSSKRMNLA